MSFLPAALPALLPWAEKSLSNVRLVLTQQDHFLNSLSDWEQSGASIPLQFCSQQWTAWWWPVKETQETLSLILLKMKGRQGRIGISRRKSAVVFASLLGSMCPGIPLHHYILLVPRSSAPPASSSCPIPPVGSQLSPPISPTLPAPGPYSLTLFLPNSIQLCWNTGHSASKCITSSSDAVAET